MNPRAEIARERRRQIQVRKAFEAGLERPGGGDLTAFCIACGDYLVFSMDRLHEQDQYIHDFLKQRIPVEDVDAHARLDELGRRQGQSRDLMEGFRQLVARLKQAGRDGLEAFEAGARRFTANFTALLAPRKNPFHRHTDELFTDEDWVVIAGVSEDSLARETALFVSVQRTAPAGIDPEQMTVEHR
jgi:hypothetical protein